MQADQPIQGNSEGWWTVRHRTSRTSVTSPKNVTSNNRPGSSKIYDNDNAGVPRIPEIDVGKNGVILSIVR